MTTKTYRVVFELRGENSDSSYDPIGLFKVLREAGLDMEQTRLACLNSDDNRLVTVKRYKMLRVTLPAWLTVREWMRNQVAWKWAWGAGVDPTWPESWQRAIAYDLHHSQHRLAVVELLKTRNFRSPFRKSLRDQIVAWMETPRADREYASPLSFTQWGKLITGRHMTAARQLDNYLYNRHRREGDEDRGLWRESEAPTAPAAAPAPEPDVETMILRAELANIPLPTTLAEINAELFGV